MKKELSFALNYALNKGFQIHPDAFKILENVDVKKLEKIIKEIVREKTSNFIIFHIHGNFCRSISDWLNVYS